MFENPARRSTSAGRCKKPLIFFKSILIHYYRFDPPLKNYDRKRIVEIFQKIKKIVT